MPATSILEAIEGLNKAYEDMECLRVPKLLKAVVSDEEVNALSCGVEVTLHVMSLMAKGEIEPDASEAFANAIVCSALEAYVSGTLASSCEGGE